MLQCTWAIAGFPIFDALCQKWEKVPCASYCVICGSLMNLPLQEAHSHQFRLTFNDGAALRFDGFALLFNILCERKESRVREVGCERGKGRERGRDRWMEGRKEGKREEGKEERKEEGT